MSRYGKVEEATRRQLRKLALTQTPLGATAVLMAQCVDEAGSIRDRAEASRELRQLLKEITTAGVADVGPAGPAGPASDADTPATVSRLSDVRGRRDRRAEGE